MNLIEISRHSWRQTKLCFLKTIIDKVSVLIGSNVFRMRSNVFVFESEAGPNLIRADALDQSQLDKIIHPDMPVI